MGGTPPAPVLPEIIYAKEMPGTAKKGCTAIYRHPKCMEGMIFSPSDDVKTMQDVYLQSVKKFKDDPYIHVRGPSKEVGEGMPPKLGEYKPHTFGEVHERAKHIGAGIAKLNLCPFIEEVPGMKVRFISIYEPNTIEWFIMDQASSLFGFAIVPIYDTLGPDVVAYIFKQTNLETLVVHRKHLADIC